MYKLQSPQHPSASPPRSAHPHLRRLNLSTLLAILFLFPIPLLHIYNQTPHAPLHPTQPFVTTLSTTTKPTTNKAPSTHIQTPPPLSIIYPRTRNSPDIPTLQQLHFLTPAILTTYSRPSITAPPPSLDIFILTHSLLLRNLTATHCLIGKTPHPAQSHIDDVVFCILPKPPPSNAPISVVLRNDQPLRASLTANKPLNAGFVAPVLTLGRHLLPWPPPSPNDTLQPPAINGKKSSASVVSYRIPSTITFNPAHVDEFRAATVASTPRYAVCHATMVAPAADMLPDWVDYHRRLGVDHTFIFDNGADVDIRHTLFPNRPDVEVVAWPWQKSQAQAFTYMLLMARRRCERLFKSDSDEFLMVGLGDNPFHKGRRPLHAFIQHVEGRFGGMRHLQVRPLNMMNSGYVRKPHGHIPELYTHVKRKQPFHNGKSICHTDVDWRAAKIHPCGILANRRVAAQARWDVESIRGLYFPRQVGDIAWLVHFYARSWEEWAEKWTAGTAGVLGRLTRDEHTGTVDVNNPEEQYVNIDLKVCERYTHFRDVWRVVSTKGAGRTGESVVAWVQKDGGRVTRVVQLSSRGVATSSSSGGTARGDDAPSRR